MKSATTYLLFAAFILLFSSCRRKPQAEVTPWGDTLTTEADIDAAVDTVAARRPDLAEIRANGEMIMLTLSGPATYYDYHGHGLGAHYLMAERLAKHLGVTLRVDLCRDTLDMLRRLRAGEGDIIAYPLPHSAQVGLVAIGTDGWATSRHSPELARAARHWWQPTMLAAAKQEESQALTTAVTRHVYPLMLSAGGGKISVYDNLFRRYAPTAGTDWTLLAAQCYQESCFDPRAHSWAGACGLMQILPSTADLLSLPRARIYEPEPNIAAAARYMRQLQSKFSDIPNPAERLRFALASYNGGYHHVRDAMALAKKCGGSPARWTDVRRYILLLAEPQYYRDPVVANGYMRGSETANYVDLIMARQQQYRHALATGKTVTSTVHTTHHATNAVAPMEATPHRAARKNKWRRE